MSTAVLVISVSNVYIVMYVVEGKYSEMFVNLKYKIAMLLSSQYKTASFNLQPIIDGGFSLIDRTIDRNSARK